MVDRGGLNYPIRVRDEFSKTTQLFRKELGASKKAFRDFQKTLKGGSSTSALKAQAAATRDLAKAQVALAKSTKAAIKPMTAEEKAAKRLSATHKQQARALAELARQQKVRERTAVALRNVANADLRREKARVKALEREVRAGRRLADAKNVEIQARKRNERAAFQEAVAIKRVEQLKAQARSQFGAGDFRGGVETLKRAKGLEKSLKRQLNTAQKLLFTFRRLVGALAIFTLARRGVQVFNDLVRAGIKFNDTIATTELGIAGLVVTLGDVRNAQGESVSAVEQLNLALGVARKQTALLRQDSLKTVATFEQLLDTFQVSVGPGLAAGLDLDEVRKLTVDISQAASALGVPQNQLAEEVRSLLSGTIQARTTRIATALGISNEDVRRLKETGELFDVLQEKFSGFAEAAQRQARQTFSGITTLIKGLVQEILGKAAKPLFEELVALGNDLFDNLLSIRDAAGNIKPSPDVVAAFQQVFDAIKRVVQAISDLGRVGALGALDAVFATIAVTIDFIRGVATQLFRIFLAIKGVVSDIAEFIGITSENTGSAAAFAGKWLVNILLIKKALSAISVRMVSIAGRAGIVVAAFVAIAKGVEFVLEKIFGIDLGIKDTIELIVVGLIGALFNVISVVSQVGTSITTFLINALDKVITAAKNKASSAKGFIASLFGGDKAAQKAAEERNARELASENRISKRKKEAEKEIAAIKAQNLASQKGLEEEISKIIGARAGKLAEGEGFRPGFDPKKAGQDASDDANVFGRARVDDAILKRVKETTVLLEAQAEAELRKTEAVLASAGPRQLALVAAQNSLELAQAELEKLEEKNALEIAPLLAQRETLAPGDELDDLNEVIDALRVRQGFEEEILRLRTLQLQKAQEEAELVANGSLTQGLKEGFLQFAEEFGSTFQAGINITRAAIDGLAQFASQAIVDAFDPTKEVDIVERFARLMQQIAQVIIQELIQLAISRAIIQASTGGGPGKDDSSVAGAVAVGTIKIGTETTIAAIRLSNALAIAAIKAASGGGFSEGGLVGLAKGGRVQVAEHYSKRAVGLARGGRPSHIPASDTIPAWLTPGEFVVNSKATRSFLPQLKAMNGDNMNVVGSASAEAAGPSTAMASGGLVADQIGNVRAGSEQGGGLIVVPAVVAREREMDTLTAGGKNALLAFMEDFAGDINAKLDRNPSGR